MTENQKYLKEARERVGEFEAVAEPERLRDAYMALENVLLAREHDPEARARLRRDCLSLWLRVLQLLDSSLDPNFDPEDVPAKLVQPPPTREGIVYPPGADPALIDEPKARAKYESAVAANREKISRYRLQTHLRRLNERLPPRAEEFIRASYTSAPADREELSTAINTVIENHPRRSSLLKLVRPSQDDGHGSENGRPA